MSITSNITKYVITSNKEVKEIIMSRDIANIAGSGSGYLAKDVYDPANISEQLVGLIATQTLTNKTLTSPVITSPTGITKSDIGLANVDNTSDLNKPISTATQTALDLKQDTGNYFDKTNDTIDDIADGLTYVKSTNDFTDTEKTKLTGIETGAEVNNISDTNATDLTDGGDSSLHYHSADRNRANHTGTQLAATISDFDTEVANNTDVAANTTHRGNTSNPHSTSDANINITDITTNDVSITKHGFVPKLPNDSTKFLDGLGAWSVPSGGGGSSTYIGLTDTQSSYTGYGLYLQRVNSAETAIEPFKYGEYTSRTINFSTADTTAQIQAKIDAVGKYIAPNVIITFQFADGTYNTIDSLDFIGFWGGGTIYVNGNTGETAGLHTSQAVIIDSSSYDCDTIRIIGVRCAIYIQYIHTITKTSTTAWRNGITFTYCFGALNVYYNYFQGNSTIKGRGIYVFYSYILSCSANYVSNQNKGISAQNGHIISSTNSSTGTSPIYGLDAYNGVIMKNNTTQPAGSTANEYTSGGGVIR